MKKNTLTRKTSTDPLICVAGKSTAHVEALIDRSKGDTIVDYRDGDEAVVAGIKKAGNGAKLRYGLDATSEHGSYTNLGKALDAEGKPTITVVLTLSDEEKAKVAPHVDVALTMVGAVHGDAKDFGFVYFRYLGRALQEGWFKPQPQVVVPGGLAGVQKALEDLKEGRANAVKYVFRIADTEGVGA